MNLICLKYAFMGIQAMRVCFRCGCSGPGGGQRETAYWMYVVTIDNSISQVLTI